MESLGAQPFHPGNLSKRDRKKGPMTDPKTQEINTILIDLEIFDSIEDLEQDTEGFQSYNLKDDEDRLFG